MKNRVAMVTGASGGIGGAIACALAADGVLVLGVGRDRERLEATARRAAGTSGQIVCRPADLSADAEVLELSRAVAEEFHRLDFLVHCAGGYHAGLLQNTPVEELDSLHRINLRAPFLLTRELMALILRSQGQIVFVNSSAGLVARAGVSAYAATKHALRGLADSIRDEVNPRGVRVLSVYPGRTASPMQRRVHEIEGRPYRPEKLLQPEDVASAVMHALKLPATAELTEIRIRPMVGAG